MARNVLTCLCFAVLFFGNMAPKVKNLGVAPDVVDTLPEQILQVTYATGAKVDEGNVLTPTVVKDQPSVSWQADANSLYLLCMTDPDAPSRENPKFREWHHWLVGNIPGEDIKKGEVLTEYVGSAPPKGSGLHRYVFLVYKQANHLSFNEQKIPKTTGNGRGKFSIRNFAKKYKLGEPVAYNTFQAQWDDYVPKIYKQLG